jgi:hypothetical protein
VVQLPGRPLDANVDCLGNLCYGQPPQFGIARIHIGAHPRDHVFEYVDVERRSFWSEVRQLFGLADLRRASAKSVPIRNAFSAAWPGNARLFWRR